MWIVCMPLYDFDVDFSQLVSVILTVIMSNVIDDFNNIQTHFAHECLCRWTEMNNTPYFLFLHCKHPIDLELNIVTVTGRLWSCRRNCQVHYEREMNEGLSIS